MERVPGPCAGATQIVVFQLEIPWSLPRALVVRRAPHSFAALSRMPNLVDVDDAAHRRRVLTDGNGAHPYPRMAPQLLCASD